MLAETPSSVPLNQLVPVSLEVCAASPLVKPSIGAAVSCN